MYIERQMALNTLSNSPHWHWYAVNVLIQKKFFTYIFCALLCRILQRTSISTNIKERLDFSCALFGPDGGLVSNAPHIPVHLGAMQEAVQYQVISKTVNLSIV